MSAEWAGVINTQAARALSVIIVVFMNVSPYESFLPKIFLSIALVQHSDALQHMHDIAKPIGIPAGCHPGWTGQASTCALSPHVSAASAAARSINRSESVVFSADRFRSRRQYHG
jgi:hypothetical protein